MDIDPAKNVWSKTKEHLHDEPQWLRNVGTLLHNSHKLFASYQYDH